MNLLVKLRHPNIVQFLGAVTERKPLMLITEYLRGVNERNFVFLLVTFVIKEIVYLVIAYFSNAKLWPS